MRVLLPVRALWCVIAALLALPGCPSLYPPGDLPGVPYGQLPSDTNDLLRLADRTHKSSRKVSKLVRARTALKKAQQRSPKDFRVLWRLARVSSLLSQRDKEHAADWAKEGYQAAMGAIATGPDRVEGHYYGAVCAGMRAQHEPARASELLEELIERAEKAQELDSTFEHGGPRRTLGVIYTLAPPWPSGVGDLDEAIELLEAVNKDYPREPLNAFYLAEAYKKAEQLQKARAYYKRAYRLGKKGKFGPEGSYYRRRIEGALVQLRRSR